MPCRRSSAQIRRRTDKTRRGSRERLLDRSCVPGHDRAAVGTDGGHIRTAVDEVEALDIALFRQGRGDRSCDFAVFMGRFRHQFASAGDFRMIKLPRMSDGVTEISRSEKKSYRDLAVCRYHPDIISACVFRGGELFVPLRLNASVTEGRSFAAAAGKILSENIRNRSAAALP